MQTGSDASPEASYFTPSSCWQRLVKKERKSDASVFCANTFHEFVPESVC